MTVIIDTFDPENPPTVIDGVTPDVSDADVEEMRALLVAAGIDVPEPPD